MQPSECGLTFVVVEFSAPSQHQQCGGDFRRTPGSPPAFVDCRADFAIRQFRLRPPPDLLLEIAQALHTPPDVIEPRRAFRDHAGDRFVVTGDDDALVRQHGRPAWRVANRRIEARILEPAIGLEPMTC